MNELEIAIFDELVDAENFEEFFVKVCILKSHFNKKELESLRTVTTKRIFLERFPKPIIYVHEMITVESISPIHNISESKRIRKYIEEGYDDKEE